MKPILKVRRILSNAKLPEYKKIGDSGADISVCLKMPYTLKPFERGSFDTGLVFEIPDGYEVQIRPRSGISRDHGITIVNTPATVDNFYRGHITLTLINLGDEDFTLTDGLRVAQAVVTPVVQAGIVEVKEISTNTDRGEGGFGSTGNK
ncbi:MAG: dUTP diphosphatase [Candidatus Hodarchaeales archaeon]|jgi:dUTP pyrophosphatase